MDRDESSRPLVERVFLGFAFFVAFVGLVGGVWWLLSETGLGTVVRDTSPGWTPAGDVMFASETDGRSQIVVTNRSGGNRRLLISSQAGDNSGAEYSRDGSRIAFETDRDGNYEIYVGPADAVAQSQSVTKHPAADRMPSWSHDGTQIVFMSNRDGKDFDIYRMNADGSGVERLTNGGSNSAPNYSPDGGQLALQIGRDSFVMTLSNKGLRRLTQEPSDGTHPSWSPDGKLIAYATTRNGRSEIFSSKANGSEAKPLVTMPMGDAIDPKWSPSGQYVAFVHVPAGLANSQGNTGQRIVYVVDSQSGRVQRVSK